MSLCWSSYVFLFWSFYLFCNIFHVCLVCPCAFFNPLIEDVKICLYLQLYLQSDRSGGKDLSLFLFSASSISFHAYISYIHWDLFFFFVLGPSTFVPPFSTVCFFDTQFPDLCLIRFWYLWAFKLTYRKLYGKCKFNCIKYWLPDSWSV